MLSVGFGCTFLSVTPKFRTPLWRRYRAGMFVAMGLSALFPVLHGLKLYGIQQMNKKIGLSWIVFQALLYILGAGIYAVCLAIKYLFVSVKQIANNGYQARVPERVHPGRFDVWGSSHQIFHVLVILAAMAHLVGLLKAFHHARSFSTC